MGELSIPIFFTLPITAWRSEDMDFRESKIFMNTRGELIVKGPAIKVVASRQCVPLDVFYPVDIAGIKHPKHLRA